MTKEAHCFDQLIVSDGEDIRHMLFHNSEGELAKEGVLSSVSDSLGSSNGDNLALAKGSLTIIASLWFNPVHFALWRELLGCQARA